MHAPRQGTPWLEIFIHRPAGCHNHPRAISHGAAADLRQ